MLILTIYGLVDNAFTDFTSLDVADFFVNYLKSDTSHLISDGNVQE